MDASLLTIVIGAFLLGTGLGALVLWAISQGKNSAAMAQIRGEVDRLQAILDERTKHAEALEDKSQGDMQTIQDLQDRLGRMENAKTGLEVELEKERQHAEEKLKVWSDAREALGDAFKALSAESLKSNNHAFLTLAQEALGKFQEAAKGDMEKRQQAIDQLVKPVRESLEKVDTKIQQIEKERAGAYEGLTQQVRNLLETQMRLQNVTGNLVQALGTPRVRGRWGEIQLRRVVELAGMLNYCDFYEQQSITTEEGRLRPDLLVRLPGGKNVIVDAKAPMSAYLEAIETVDEKQRKEKLSDHSRLIRNHMSDLSKKDYWKQFDPSPEFVILFLPNESFFSAALQMDPALIEDGVGQRVILATPTTLITLLKAVSFGWRQESLAKDAKAIADLGKDLYKRLGDMTKHIAGVGNRLKQAVETYDQMVGTYESRVLVTARRFHELQVGTDQKEIEALPPIGLNPRDLKQE